MDPTEQSDLIEQDPPTLGRVWALARNVSTEFAVVSPNTV